MPRWKKDRKWDAPCISNRNLSVAIQILITPSTELEIKNLLKEGVFPNLSEFGRYTIRKYLDEYYEIEEWKRRFK